MPGEGTDKADGSDKTTVAQNCQAVAMETSGTPRLFSYGWLDGALTILQSSVMLHQDRWQLNTIFFLSVYSVSEYNMFCSSQGCLCHD